MKENFFFGISAISQDIRIFMLDIIHNKTLIGFSIGFLTTILIIGFILTKNPKHIPTILRYSSIDAFQKISKRDKNGTFQMAFTKFVKIYTQVRTLFFVTMLSFFVMIITITITK